MPSVDGVTQIEVPGEAKARSTLVSVDYADAFLTRTGPTKTHTSEEWARMIFDEAPLPTRTSLLAGWSTLGLKLGSPRSNAHVLGWAVRTSAPEFTLLHADGRLGLTGELLVELHRDELLFCTFVQLRNPAARAVWAGVEPVHAQVVPRVLAHVVRSVGLETPEG